MDGNRKVSNVLRESSYRGNILFCIGIHDPSPAITQTVGYIPKAHNLKAKATSMIYETIERLFASRCYTRRIR